MGASTVPTATPAKLDTEDAIITVSGQIDLARELLALDVRPKSKGLRIITFRSPLYVAGSFKSPDVGVNKGVLALKAGGAIALGVVAPVAGLLPLVNIGADQQTDCAGLLAEAERKPSAPAPGKTARRTARVPQNGH